MNPLPNGVLGVGDDVVGDGGVGDGGVGDRVPPQEVSSQTKLFSQSQTRIAL